MSSMIEHNTLQDAYTELSKMPAKRKYYIYKNIRHKYCISTNKESISKLDIVICEICNYNDYHNLGKKILRKQKLENINKNSTNE